MNGNKNMTQYKMTNEVPEPKFYKSQAEAFAHESDFYIAQDVNNGAKRYTPCTLEQIDNFCGNDSNLYEMLH